MLHQAAAEAGCPRGALSARHVASLAALVTGWHGQRWADLPGRDPGRTAVWQAAVHRAGSRGAGRRHEQTRRARVDATDLGSDLDKVLITAESCRRGSASWPRRSTPITLTANCCWSACSRARSWSWPTWPGPCTCRSQMDWMAVSSYGSGTKSSGVVRILKDLDADITGRHVLVVEDIVDSGLTLSWLVGNLQSRQPGVAARSAPCCASPPRCADRGATSPTPGSTSATSSSSGYGLDYARALPQPALHRDTRAARVRRGTLPPLKYVHRGRGVPGERLPVGRYAVSWPLRRRHGRPGVPSGIPAHRPEDREAAHDQRDAKDSRRKPAGTRLVRRDRPRD